MPQAWDPYWGALPSEELPPPQVVDFDQSILKLREELDETRRKRLIQFGKNNAQNTLAQQGEPDLFELISSNGRQLVAAS